MSVQEIFADMVWDWVSLRLKIIAFGVNQDRGEGDPLPFMLSNLFMARFERVLRQLVIPKMIQRSAGIINQMSEKPPEEEQKKFLIQCFNDRKSRLVLWEAWQAAWELTMTPQHLPPKPKPIIPARGLMALLKKRKPENTGLTEEQWAKQVKKVENGNKVSEKAWAHMQGDGKEYISPDKEDGKMLVDFFGRSINALKEQMTAIRQIVAQGGNIAKTFDLFQQKKNVNLSLLAVCYQSPEIFLQGNQALKDIMRGQSPKAFSLIARFLPDHIKGA